MMWDGNNEAAPSSAVEVRLGLNLSFAVKRWLNPGRLAALCVNLGIESVQMTLDIVDPWWPQELRAPVAARYRDAFAAHGVRMDAVFGGIAGYTFPQLLAESEEERRASAAYFRRCLDVSRELGADTYGSPVGGMESGAAADSDERHRAWDHAVAGYRDLLQYAGDVGVTTMLIEPTPIAKELLDTPGAVQEFLDAVETPGVRVGALIDWGHAMMAQPDPLAAVDRWYRELADRIYGVHVQQTDGVLDRHWGFERNGLVTAADVRRLAQRHELSNVDHYLEVIAPFEAADDDVLDSVRRSIAAFHM